jgi:hypothetical protein
MIDRAIYYNQQQNNPAGKIQLTRCKMGKCFRYFHSKLLTTACNGTEQHAIFTLVMHRRLLMQMMAMQQG